MAAGAASARADEVTDWTRMMLRAALVVSNSPTVVTRSAAMLQVAMFDAINGVDPKYTHFFVEPAAKAGASKRAAAAYAAHTVLTKLYGSGATPANATLQGAFDNLLRTSLLEIGADDSTTAVADGKDWGILVGTKVLDRRATDGFAPIPPATSFPPFPDDTTIGKWRRTPNLPASTALSPAGAGYIQFSHQMTWALESYSQFRPVPPPALNSAQYAKDFNETKEMGSFSSTKRTPDQSENAIFWGTGTGTFIWNDVALRLLEERERKDDDHYDRWDFDHGRRNGHRNRLLDHARLLAQLNVAQADAIIGCWDSKYIEAYWRPVTAIRDPGDDGNAATTADPNWMPYIVTPGHPEYPSGHSCASGAAGEILAEAFGDRTTFTAENDLLPGVVRKYRSFSSALEEVKNARIYSGIHFRTACDIGQQLGINVARYIMETKFQRLK
jgi:hypothetical protein